MVSFLMRHSRYNTMRSWNRMHSYSNCLKVHSVGYDHETLMKVFDILQTSEFSDTINDLLHEFARGYDFKWQAAFNGRSGGYLVLYEGDLEPSGYKSFCSNCGQRNYTSIKETGCKCGRCGEQARKDYATTHMNTKTYMRGVDEDQDYSEWSISDLKSRVEVVQAFDALCDSIVAETKYLADNFVVETETVYIPQERLILVEKSA